MPLPLLTLKGGGGVVLIHAILGSGVVVVVLTRLSLAKSVVTPDKYPVEVLSGFQSACRLVIYLL